MIKLKLKLILESVFDSGYCFEFAIAMKQLFNYKLGVVIGIYKDEDGNEGDTFEVPGHVFVVHPKDKSLGIDCRGIRSISTIVKQTMFEGTPLKVTWRIDSEENIENLFGMDSESEAVKQAKKHIQQRLKSCRV